MDKELQQRIEEARQNGYTDEEINEYLASRTQQPTTPSPPTYEPRDRTEEKIGFGVSLFPDSLKNVGIAFGAGLGAKKIYDLMKTRGTQQAAQQMALQQAMQQAAAQTAAGQAAQTAAGQATGTGGQGAFSRMAGDLSDNTIRANFRGSPATTPIAPSSVPPSTNLPSVGRVVGRALPYVGLGLSGLEAMEFARSQNLGQKLSEGQGRAAQSAYRGLVNRNVSGYQPTPQEAKNILDSGDSRMIQMYGGPDRLKRIVSVSGPVKPGNM